MKKLLALGLALAVVACKKDEDGSRDTDASARADTAAADVREAAHDADSAMDRAGDRADRHLRNAAGRIRGAGDTIVPGGLGANSGDSAMAGVGTTGGPGAAGSERNTGPRPATKP